MKHSEKKVYFQDVGNRILLNLMKVIKNVGALDITINVLVVHYCMDGRL
jgi:hypothetical protein